MYNNNVGLGHRHRWSEDDDVSGRVLSTSRVGNTAVWWSEERGIFVLGAFFNGNFQNYILSYIPLSSMLCAIVVLFLGLGFPN
jgi:hypothetical protein